MRGLNTTVGVRRRNATTETWADAYSSLPFRVEDLREIERENPQYRAFTDYTHLGFCPFKVSGSAVVLKVRDLVTDSFDSEKYRIESVVDAAGHHHHREIMMTRIEKK